MTCPQQTGDRGHAAGDHIATRESVATYATHDHKPIRALWDQALDHSDSDAAQQAQAILENIAEFARLRQGYGGQAGLNSKIEQLDFEKDFYPAIMKALFKCNSWIAMVMITDLLARKYRFNVPGTKANLNWTRRMQRSIAQLRSSRKERNRMRLVHEMLVKTGRV